MMLGRNRRNGSHLVAILLSFCSESFVKGQDCSSTTPCVHGSSFCDFEYGNRGNCVPCSLSACLEPNRETKGVVDCFKSCNISPKESPSVPSCHGYVLDTDTYIPNQGPFPVPCGSKYGDSGTPFQYQQSSCCTATGSAQISQAGGFEAVYGSPGHFPICSAYVHALTGLLCDPRQGMYIRTTSTDSVVLRVCRESCDAVFANCGLPGDVFPEWTTYTDGTSLCKEMWGGFGSATTCDGRPDGYACQTNLTIDIVDDDCLQMVFPSGEDLDHFKNELGAPNPVCLSLKRQRRIRTIVIPAIMGFIAVLLNLVGICVCIRCKRNDDMPDTDWTDHDAVTAIPVKVDTIADEEGPHKHQKKYDDPVHHKHQKKYDDPVHAMDPPMAEVLPAPIMAEALPVPNTNNSIHVVTGADCPAPGKMQVWSEVPNVPPIADFVGGSQDKTGSISTWFAAHPPAAASLTPEDVAAVLSKVSFSLDQPTVSKLLAEGITKNGGLIYTTHVIAAMDNSASHQGAEIAKLMVPYVIDPENKDRILSKLGSSFSKNEISRYFKTHN